jgi:hypothetical protein
MRRNSSIIPTLLQGVESDRVNMRTDFLTAFAMAIAPKMQER